MRPHITFTDHNFGETSEGMPIHTAIMRVGGYEVEVDYEAMTEILKVLGHSWSEE